MQLRKNAMENATLARAVEVVRALRPDEQQQLRRMMDSWQVPPPVEVPAPEREFLESLLAKGIISRIPNRYQKGHREVGYERHPPIVVQGEPVSETVIQERR